jgi:hypothetical protein
MPQPSEIVYEQLDALLTDRLLAMIEETLLAMDDVGVTYEMYAAALTTILLGAARALNHVADTEAYCAPAAASRAREASIR